MSDADKNQTPDLMARLKSSLHIDKTDKPLAEQLNELLDAAESTDWHYYCEGITNLVMQNSGTILRALEREAEPHNCEWADREPMHLRRIAALEAAGEEAAAIAIKQTKERDDLLDRIVTLETINTCSQKEHTHV